MGSASKSRDSITGEVNLKTYVEMPRGIREVLSVSLVELMFHSMPLTSRRSISVVFLKTPETLQLPIPPVLLVSIDANGFNGFRHRGAIIKLPHLRHLKDLAEVIGACMTESLQLAKTAIAPGGSDLVGRKLAAIAHGASDFRRRHGGISVLPIQSRKINEFQHTGEGRTHRRSLHNLKLISQTKLHNFNLSNEQQNAITKFIYSNIRHTLPDTQFFIGLCLTSTGRILHTKVVSRKGKSYPGCRPFRRGISGRPQNRVKSYAGLAGSKSTSESSAPRLRSSYL